MNKFAVISDKVPQICDALEKFGYKLIYTESVDGFISYEQNHADMQVLHVDDKLFVLSVCKQLQKTLISLGFDVNSTTNDVRGEYPHNILLNAKIVGKNIIGKIDHLDSKLKDYCIQNGYNFINVNQGYAACSCVNIANKAVITSDISIYKALENSNIDVLKISQEGIKLHGAGENTCGLIGGACATLYKSTILFFGDIEKHADYIKIREFCAKHNVDIKSIKNIPLTDIGGTELLNN